MLHAHFGMSGAFKTLPRGGAPPETTPNTRLLLTGEKVVALLSAMIVQHGGFGATFLTFFFVILSSNFGHPSGLSICWWILLV